MKSPESQPNMDRRSFLKGSAAGVAVGAMGVEQGLAQESASLQEIDKATLEGKVPTQFLDFADKVFRSPGSDNPNAEYFAQLKNYEEPGQRYGYIDAQGNCVVVIEADWSGVDEEKFDITHEDGYSEITFFDASDPESNENRVIMYHWQAMELLG